MHRQGLLGLLDAYEPLDAADARSLARFLEFVAREPRCFERSLGEGHVTGSSWLVNGEGTRVLLTHHRKLGRWLQLGGHSDGDPDPLAVALREAREESGLDGIEAWSRSIFDLDIHSIPARPEEPEHLHYDVRFVLRVRGTPGFLVSEESLALAWVPIDTLAERQDTDPSIRRMAQKWRAIG